MSKTNGKKQDTEEFTVLLKVPVSILLSGKIDYQKKLEGKDKPEMCAILLDEAIKAREKK